ncbi:MAG: hypothetical protein HY741_22635 [Chloroflexi bacterium]|nr:hypothetical protein [Chloroflexota bacterium]
MDEQSLSIAADIAAIFLVVQLLLFTLIMAVSFGMGWWYLRKGRKALVLPFLYAQVYTLRVQQVTMKVTDAIASAPIGIHTTAEQIKVTAQSWLRGSRGQGN